MLLQLQFGKIDVRDLIQRDWSIRELSVSLLALRTLFQAERWGYTPVLHNHPSDPNSRVCSHLHRAQSSPFVAFGA